MYFECHAHVRIRFKLASVVGKGRVRDGGVPQGCTLSMMVTVALYLPWRLCLESVSGVTPQLHADNLMCTCTGSDDLLMSERFATNYSGLLMDVRLPAKCVLPSTDAAVRGESRISDGEDHESVKLDVGDSGGHYTLLIENELPLFLQGLNGCRVGLVIRLYG